jgi:glycolate oxidase iron-sulfur subunit
MSGAEYQTKLGHQRQRIESCVHCGLCLPACPTYVATGNENDSPRGRIYLMRAVGDARLSPGSETFRSHIDRCLGCRACESACPSGVEYGHLLEAARVDVEANRTSVGAARFKRLMLNWVWPVTWRRRALMLAGRMTRASGIAKFLTRSRISTIFSRKADIALRLLDATCPAELDITTCAVDARAETGGRVAVFRGCTADLFSSVDGAMSRVLKANCLEPHAPIEQECCGALHAHSGFIDEARRLARNNIDAFKETDDPIVTSAGGCGAMLVDYGDLLAEDPDYRIAASKFAARVKDIGQVLKDPRAVVVTSSKERVTYDISCHLLHGQHAAEESRGMLKAIQGLEIVPLKDSDVCCGGAGIYNLLEPNLSEEILARKVDQICASGATLVATANPGCLMQIARGLAGRKNTGIRVCHPIEILDHAYRSAGLYRQHD